MLATVTTLLDANNANDELTTLREAIVAANRAQDIDTISFSTIPANGLSGGTITLTSAAGGQLSITQSVTIDASMLSGGVTIHAAANSRIFNISGTGLVTMKNLKLTGGDADKLADGTKTSQPRMTPISPIGRNCVQQPPCDPCHPWSSKSFVAYAA